MREWDGLVGGWGPVGSRENVFEGHSVFLQIWEGGDGKIHEVQELMLRDLDGGRAQGERLVLERFWEGSGRGLEDCGDPFHPVQFENWNPVFEEEVDGREELVRWG